MGKRRKGRELLVQALYAAELSGQPLHDCLDDQLERRQASAETAAFARPLADVIAKHREALDADVNRLLDHWDPDRVGNVERAIFRLAIAELRHCPEVPPSVVINEACEVARLFCDEDAVRFVNGLLDRAAREMAKAEPK
ncbi:MAG TPA: transcription antitermination factor NusB [Candidatus Krumholzibacteria bacterium]|nr:transcription antitermination factor NusB [Candidatus Krumholzibacteria bacterium]HRX50066.1 transcription antitermination factor NusB [Candidatus Krumholzibacteria bacterium]